MKAKWYNSSSIIVLVHAAFWLLLLSLPLLLRSYEQRPPQPTKAPLPPSGYFYYFKSMTLVSFFYLNAYVLVPLLFYKKKYGRYLLSMALVIGFFLLVDFAFFYLSGQPFRFHIWAFISFNTLPFLFILALSMAYRMYRDRIKIEHRSKERETMNLQTELTFLRSQISPHFLFNILNNMVALARKKSDLLEPSLIKLSSLLRYMLYETDTQEVSLSREVEYLNSYIDLQQQRFGKNVQVYVTMQEIDGQYFIEPMLLIPFVENAFKHGVGLMEKAEIYIDLWVEGNELHFQVKNRFSNEKEIKDKTSGIGLANVARRLNILYQDSHKLLIHKRDGWFVVFLQLKLH